MKKQSHIIIFVTILSLFSSLSWATVELDSEKKKLSYALGAYLGNSIYGQNVDLDIPAFLQAVEDILKKTDLKMTDEEMQEVLSAYQQKLIQQRNSAANDNKTASEKFLAENREKDGVVTLDSGLQYKVIKAGDGEKPNKDSNVKVHYHGTHIDGRVFDSSYERGEPISFSLNQVIKGWQEALPLMKVGAKYQFYIPPELAYGERGAGNSIGPNEALIFDIELLGIN